MKCLKIVLKKQLVILTQVQFLILFMNEEIINFCETLILKI